MVILLCFSDHSLIFLFNVIIFIVCFMTFLFKLPYGFFTHFFHRFIAASFLSFFLSVRFRTYLDVLC